MDKDTLQELANIATVRSYINNILNMGRGVIDQKTMHRVSAKSTLLDKLFVDTLLNPRSQAQTPNFVAVEEEEINLAERLAEEKAKLNRNQGVANAKEVRDRLAKEESKHNEQDRATIKRLEGEVAKREYVESATVVDQSKDDELIFAEILAQAQSEANFSSAPTTKKVVAKKTNKKVTKKRVSKK